MNDGPRTYRANCYCGWRTTHYSDSVCAARLRSHARSEHGVGVVVIHPGPEQTMLFEGEGT